jgi:hypothetical protein
MTPHNRPRSTRDRGQFVPSRRRRTMADVRGERLLKVRQNRAPSCVFPALQLKREWSPWPKFGSDRRASFRRDNLRRRF